MNDKLILSVILNTEEKGLVSGLKVGGVELKKFGDDAEQAGKDTEEFSKKTSNSTKAINVLSGALAAVGFGSLAADMYGSIDSLQGYQAQLKTITGDLESAGVELDRLIGFARTTPFTIEQSVDAFTKLTHLGLTPSERAMTSYGNTASAMGKDMMQMVEAVADASVFEFERLKEFGIKASQQKDKVSFTFQGITTTVKKNSEEIQQYLLAIGENQFAGAMSDQMERLSSRASNLGIAFDVLYQKVGDYGVADAAGEAIDNIADGVYLLGNNLPVVADKLETLAAFFVAGTALHYAPILFTAMKVKTLAFATAVGTATKATTLLQSKQAALMALYAGWEIGSYLNDEFVDIRTSGLKMIGALDKGATHISYAFKKSAKAIDIAWDNAINFIYENFADLLELIADGAELLGMDKYAEQFSNWESEVRFSIDAAEDYEKTMGDLNLEQDAAIKIIDDNIDALVAHEYQMERSKTETKEATTETKTNTKAVEESTKTISLNETAFQALQDRLDPVGKLTRDLESDQTLLSTAFKLGKIDIEQYELATATLNKTFDEQVEKTEAALNGVDEYAQSWEKAVERVDTAIADGWLDLLEGKSTSVFDSILDGFNRMLAEMLHMAITKPIMLNIQQGITAAGGGGMFGGGGSGGFGNLLNLASGGIGGGIMGIGNSIAGAGSMLGLGGVGAFGSGFASTGAILGTQGLVGGMGTAFSNIGALFGSGSIGAGIGAALPIVGMIAGAAKLVDSLSGGGLFGTSYKTTDHGVNLNYSGGGFGGENYEKKKKKRSLFRGTKRKIVTSDLDPNIVSGMNDYFNGVEDLIVSAASALDITEVEREITIGGGEFGQQFMEGFGGSIETTTETITQSLDQYLSSFTASTQLSLENLSEEDAARAIQDWTTATANNLVGGFFGEVLDGMAFEGEQLTDTLTRVIQQLAVTETAFDSINLSLSDLAASAGVSSVQYADDVALEAGGVDRLAALVQTYQTAFFSEEELLVSQLTDAAAQMEIALGLVGAEQDEFRAQFEAASGDGLAAGAIVDWLEAGALVAQFEALTDQLTNLSGEDAAALIEQALIDGQQLANDYTADVGIADPSVEATVQATETQTEAITGTMTEQTQVMQDLNETSKVHHNESISQLTRIGNLVEQQVSIVRETQQENDSLKQQLVSLTQNITTLQAKADKWQTPPIIVPTIVEAPLWRLF